MKQSQKDRDNGFHLHVQERKQVDEWMKQNKIKLEIKDLRLSEVQWMVGESEGGGI